MSRLLFKYYRYYVIPNEDSAGGIGLFSPSYLIIISSGTTKFLYYSGFYFKYLYPGTNKTFLE